MKLFLFGGAELNDPRISPIVLKDQIKKVFLKIKPQSILHVPYARLHPYEDEWKEGWFKDIMKETGIEILDARSKSDLEKASKSVIFINGGIERRQLIESVNENNKLLNLILSANYILAESAGSMAMGEYMTVDRSGKEIIKGLGILKNTIIEVHFTERKRQELLKTNMARTKMHYGIGIDCATALVTDPSDFPKNWNKIGVGNVYIENKLNK